VGLGLLIVVDLRRFLGLVQVMATFAAEPITWKDWSAAFWAKIGKLFSALPEISYFQDFPSDTSGNS
jgi:hypothetical protein